MKIIVAYAQDLQNEDNDSFFYKGKWFDGGEEDDFDHPHNKRARAAINEVSRIAQGKVIFYKRGVGQVKQLGNHIQYEFHTVEKDNAGRQSWVAVVVEYTKDEIRSGELFGRGHELITFASKFARFAHRTVKRDEAYQLVEMTSQRISEVVSERSRYNMQTIDRKDMAVVVAILASITGTVALLRYLFKHKKRLGLKFKLMLQNLKSAGWIPGKRPKPEQLRVLQLELAKLDGQELKHLADSANIAFKERTAILRLADTLGSLTP